MQTDFYNLIQYSIDINQEKYTRYTNESYGFLSQLIVLGYNVY